MHLFVDRALLEVHLGVGLETGSQRKSWTLELDSLFARITMVRLMSELEVIGWKESIDLPDLGIKNMLAKADTGARSSALDVKNIEELGDGKIRFDIVLNRKDRDQTKTVVAKIAHQKHVRSSNGQEHERYFIKTRILIGTKTKEVEFSLASRKTMVCRILLGRKALENDFLVDSASKYQSRPRRKVVNFEI